MCDARRAGALVVLTQAMGCGPIGRSAPTPPATTAARAARRAFRTLANPAPEGRSPTAAAAPQPILVPEVPRPEVQPIVDAPASSASDDEPACPVGMVLVSGSFCPTVEQQCLEHTADYVRDEAKRARRIAQGLPAPPTSTPERCLRYREPTVCTSAERRPMRFCIDRYEWPNVVGRLPELAVNGCGARAKCSKVGKRLCDAEEFTFACEGEAMLPYSYGHRRDAAICNIDKPYVVPRRPLLPYEFCLNDAACRTELARLDQREPVGARASCRSPFGVMDINGNVNEWVNRPGEAEPWRSGLMGGWWGPARSRCRPIVTAHNEHYVGYEVGFRCCKDAAPLVSPPRPAGTPTPPVETSAPDAALP